MEGLVLKNINKIYPGGEHAVKDCTFEADRGELFVLTGPENCGKTTLLRMIAGLEEITSGELYLNGKPANETSLKERDAAMTFQSQSLSPNQTVYDNLAYGLKIRKMPEELIEQKVRAVAEILGLSELLFRKTKVLTGIQRQRVALGRIVVREPKVILLDEPLSHLDRNLRTQMRAEIVKLQMRLDTVFVYATHDPAEAMAVGTKIAVMKDGVIHQIDTPQNLYDRPADFFVSDFMGWRSTSFFNATLGEENGVFAKVGERQIELTDSCAKSLKNAAEYLNTGKAVTLGVHREDVRIAGGSGAVKATVSSMKTDAGKTVAVCALGGDVFVEAAAERALGAGDEVELTIDTERLQLFDSESGAALRA